MKKFVQNQIIIADIPDSVGTGGDMDYPFEHGEKLLFLGEIVQMPGHCIVIMRNGKVSWGVHTSDFRHPNEDEV